MYIDCINVYWDFTPQNTIIIHHCTPLNPPLILLNNKSTYIVYVKTGGFVLWLKSNFVSSRKLPLDKRARIFNDSIIKILTFLHNRMTTSNPVFSLYTATVTYREAQALGCSLITTLTLYILFKYKQGKCFIWNTFTNIWLLFMVI